MKLGRGALVRAFGVIAFTPFAAVAIVHCARNPPDPNLGQSTASASGAASPSNNASDSASGSALGSASTSTPSVPDSAPSANTSGSASAAGSQATVVSTTWKGSFPTAPGARGKCLDLARAHAAFLESHRACASSSDCESVSASCGLEGICGAPMNKAFRAGLKQKDEAYTSADCMTVLAAPCPSCASRGTPACVAGRCELVVPRP